MDYQVSSHKLDLAPLPIDYSQLSSHIKSYGGFSSATNGLCPDISSHKGSSINDLRGGGRGKIEDELIFPPGMPFENYLFFPGEGPPLFFFLDFLRPHPQIINGRSPLSWI